MSELLLVNPRKRRATRKRRSRRRMTALQRQYFGKRRSTRRHHRRSVEVMQANPAPKRHRRRRHAAGGKRRSFRRRVAGRVSRLQGFNPSSFLRDTLVPSAVGAAGALGVDIVLGYATPYLPSVLTTGIGAPIAKLGAAVGLGMVAGMVTNRRVGEQVMAGAVTVVLYSYLKKQVQASLPNLTMSGFGYAGPAMAFPDRLGMYVSDQAPVPPAVVAAIAANAASKAVGKTAPAAQTVGEYVSGYEGHYMY